MLISASSGTEPARPVCARPPELDDEVVGGGVVDVLRVVGGVVGGLLVGGGVELGGGVGAGM